MPALGYVLAGGRSRRMGRDKAVLPLEDRGPMALHVASVLTEAGCEAVRLVGRSPELVDLGLPLVLDPPEADYHPLWGVAAALHDARARSASSILVVPCDLPDLDVCTVARLLDAAPPSVAVSGGHLQPLVAHLPVAWLARTQALARAGLAARRLWTAAPAPYGRLAVEEAPLRDLDTPADLARWTQRQQRGG